MSKTILVLFTVFAMLAFAFAQYGGYYPLPGRPLPGQYGQYGQFGGQYGQFGQGKLIFNFNFQN